MPRTPATKAHMTDVARPAASVVVLAYRAATTIARCLRSLRRQTLAESFEVIVVWSGDDETRAVVATEFPETVLVGRRERLLTGAARNLGLAHARGEVVAFLAGDCEAHPEWLARRVAAHREGHLLVGGAVECSEPAGSCARAGHWLEYNACPPGRPRELVKQPIYNLSFDRRVFECHGRYDASLPCGEDTALVWRLVAAGSTFLFDPAIRITHPSADSVAELWRHQAWHGFWLGKLSRARAVPGVDGRGAIRYLRLLAYYPIGRLARLARRVWAWQRDKAGEVVVLAPWLLLGVLAATWGLVRGLLAPHPGAAESTTAGVEVAPRLSQGGPG